MRVRLPVGPAAGHWYAGDYWTTGMSVRGSGLIGIGIGVPLALSGICFMRSGGGCGDSSDARTVVGVTFAVLGAVAVVVGTGLDLARADDAARAYNDGHGSLQRAPAFSFGGQF